MKLKITAAVATLSSLALAGDQNILGTKSDPISANFSTGSAPAVSPMPMIQMFVALVIVLGLVKVVLPKVVGKVNKKLTTTIHSGIKIEESAHFAGGTLYVVNAKSKTLLLSVTPQGVSCLADISEAPKPEPPSFEELIAAAPAIPDFVFKAPEPSPTQVEDALARLSLLTN